jgi:hypothetical protein
MLGILLLCLFTVCVIVQISYAVYILVAANYECREFERWSDKIKQNYDLGD